MTTSQDNWLSVAPGDAPLVVSIPHAGTWIPDDMLADFASPWQARRDADWWVGQLYDFVRQMGATVVATQVSRSVIDVNRDPSGASLYPGMATTGLCPDTDFDGGPLYLAGRAPDAAQIEARRERFHAPYQAALQAQIDRLRQSHPRVVLYDCHSIRSHIPRLFDGVLPDMNIGTNEGRSCAPELERLVQQVCGDSGFSHVLNGRFKGGWITRHYGNPQGGVHAVQMELACHTYMDEPSGAPDGANWPSPWNPARAQAMQTVLQRLMRSVLDWAA